MCEVTYKGKPIKITIYLSEETLTAKRAWNDEFQALKENNSHQTLVQPTKVSFKITGKIKTSNVSMH
jgi:hypothetical protein